MLILRLLEQLKDLDRQVGELEFQIKASHRSNALSCMFAVNVPASGSWHCLAASTTSYSELKGRSGGRAMARIVDKLRTYMLGWKGYFKYAETPEIWRKLDEWLRHRLRAIQLKHWRRGTTCIGNCSDSGPRLPSPNRWRQTAAAGGATRIDC